MKERDGGVDGGIDSSTTSWAYFLFYLGVIQLFITYVTSLVVSGEVFISLKHLITYSY